jgi:4a-hydroxytetrahydrobiopterin dehydratase
MTAERPSTMPDAEVALRLKEHPAWRREDGCIVRRIEFATFSDGIEFINQVARVATQIDHHPDIQISWRRVTLTLCSHDAGGITARDFALAGRIDALASENKEKITS